MRDMIYPIGAEAAERPRIRKVGLQDLRLALREGWDDYRAMRGEMLLLSIIYPVVGLLSALLFSGGGLPMLFPLSAGLALVAPALASGFYELSRCREAGRTPDWSCVAAVFRPPVIGALAGLSALVFALFALWLVAARAVWGLTLDDGQALAPAEFLRRVLTTREGWTMIAVGNLVGLPFAAAVLVLSIISFPMVVDRRAGPFTAAETSLRFAAANPGPTAAWGLTVAVLLVLGSIPLFVGLAVVLPVLGYATWRLYARAVEP